MAVYIDGQRRDTRLNVVGESTRSQRYNEEPNDLERVGYDADTQTYTYRDNQTGAHYEGEEGNRYGNVHPTGQNSARYSREALQSPGPSGWQYFAPFAVIVIVVLLLLFRFVGNGYVVSPPKCGDGMEAHAVVKGESCWGIADARGMSVEELKEVNPGLVCDRLAVGAWVCVKHVV